MWLPVNGAIPLDVGPPGRCTRPMTAGVDPTNIESAKNWDGPSGSSWVTHADQHDRTVARYLGPFFAEIGLEPTHRVLDVGCGNGLTSIEAARRAREVTGVDLSSAMLDVARGRAAGLTNVTFVQADVQIAALDPAGYDRVISRNGTMFFGDPVAAFTNLGRALVPGGRLVMQVWQPYAEQEWLRAFREVAGAGPLPADGPSPVGLGEPETIRRVLGGAGFAEPRITGHAEPVHIGADLAAAEEMALAVLGGMLGELAPEERAGAVERLRASLADHLGPDGVTYRSAVWFVTAERAR